MEQPECKDDFEKVAFIAGLAKGIGGLAFKAVKNPLATLGTAATVAFNASEMSNAASAASQRVGKVKIPIPPPGV
jgi:hypothetical protein